MFEINIRDAFTDKNYNVDVSAEDAQIQMDKIRKICIKAFGADDIVVNIEDVHDKITETWNAELIKEYILIAEDNTYEAVDAWLDYILPYGRGVKNALELFKRCFMGVYNNIESAAEDYFFHEYRNMIEPYWVEDCIDYTKLAKILIQDEILLPIYYDILGFCNIFVFSKVDNWEE